MLRFKSGNGIWWDQFWGKSISLIIGNAKIAGMATDLNLSSNEYSIALIVFFVRYVFFEPPSNLLLICIKPSLYLAAIMIHWSNLTCCMAAIKDYHHLIILRIFVGVFEAEQAKRFAAYISAAILYGAFGGLLARAITGGLEGTHGEHAITITRIQDGGITTTSKGDKKRTIAFILGYMVIAGSSTLSYFYPTLLNGLIYTSSVQAQYMTVAIYAVAFVCTAITGYFAIKTPTPLSFAGATFRAIEPEVRVVAPALVIAIGNLAQIYGAYLFPADDKPKYLMGSTDMMRSGVYNILSVEVRSGRPSAA
ncbi:hypothetical protein CC80DRAFT_521097 [Byssothecium circinans]|uniref:Uncharacterized protein n=1 Tax=Byssothecium circinans TaxID=147558 RepID=A0A6A5T9W8_9PLEO|nr:hypothetical protein CC80DRAFT_521097 [Byssothecium circinans]